MSLTAAFNDQLKETSVTHERFREITGRLFASGVIFRDENTFEERMYDDARRIVPMLDEYFSLSGFRMFHDAESTFIRLYPPGAWVPGQGEADCEGEKLLRTRLSADFVATALMLRFLYQQGLAEGRIEPSEEVHVRMEDLALAMTAHLGRVLPEGKTDRGNLFKELKRQRIVRFNEETDFNNGDGFIAIRRPILSLVGEEALRAALDVFESRKMPVMVEGAAAVETVVTARESATAAIDDVDLAQAELLDGGDPPATAPPEDTRQSDSPTLDTPSTAFEGQP